MEEITLKLSPAELAALQTLAQKTKHTIEETATRIVLVQLIKEDLLEESAERNGSRFVRLDE